MLKGEFSADELDFEECETTKVHEIPSMLSAPPLVSFESDEEMCLDEEELQGMFGCFLVSVDSLILSIKGAGNFNVMMIFTV